MAEEHPMEEATHTPPTQDKTQQVVHKLREYAQTQDIQVEMQLVHFFLEEAKGNVEEAVQMMKEQLNINNRNQTGQVEQQTQQAETSNLRRRRRQGEGTSHGMPATSSMGYPPRADDRTDGRDIHGVVAVMLICWRAFGRALTLSVKGVTVVASVVIRSTQHILRLVIPPRLASVLSRFISTQLTGTVGSTDPIEAASLFKDYFQSMYCTLDTESPDTSTAEPEQLKMMPDFQLCGYKEALNRSRHKCFFLACYLHAPEDGDANRFCKDTLSDARMASFLSDNFVVWGGSIVDSREAFQLSRALRVGKYPCLAILTTSSLIRNFGGAPSQRQETASSSSTALLASFEGYMGVDQLISLLEKVLEDHGPMLVAARAEQEERDFNRRIREEQEVEYAAALEVDRKREAEKEALLQEERERERQALKDACALKEEEKKEELRKQAVEDRRRERASTVEEEPPKGEGVARILIRLPDGSRIERRFLKEEKVQSIYDFVDSLESNKCLKYYLVSNFPRRVFDDESSRMSTLVESELYPQASLFLQSCD